MTGAGGGRGPRRSRTGPYRGCATTTRPRGACASRPGTARPCRRPHPAEGWARRRDALRTAAECRPPRPHRESVGPAPTPRSLLPLDTLALAALAVQVHGWELGVRSRYLPAELLGSPDTLHRAAESEPDNSGPRYAK
ncbi:Imm49 family immunity protein [Streptomyces rubiginosohelvolus]|uniref:Imm49 family immunity protein n=1 Tax=Streptomyces rubiginosohelvolus TaxID=67362 RepID=UPI0035E18D7C